MRRLARPLLYVGVAAVVLALGQYHGATVGRYDFTTSSRFGWALAYIVLQCLCAYAVGLPDVPGRFRSRVPTAALAGVLGALSISTVQLLVGDALLPRFVVFGSALLLVPWFALTSALAGLGRAASEQRDRVLVVGPQTLVAELSQELAGAPERPGSIVASLDEEAAAAVDPGHRPLLQAASTAGATVLVLSTVAQGDERIVQQAAVLHEAGIRVRTHSLFYEEWLGKIPVADLGRVALFFDIGEIHRERYGRVKRILDVAIGVVGVVALVVVVPLVGVGDLVANRGSMFYVQDRVGRSGRPFRILKFRTIRGSTGPDEPASTDWTAVADPRVTPFGRFLRRTHLDELPQALNILRGDLSTVGPRPEQPRYVAELVGTLPYYDLRHIVRPGLTGWAQVKYGYAGDERDALEKLQYDFHYLRRQSVLFDLRIIARTVRTILGGQGSGR